MAVQQALALESPDTAVDTRDFFEFVSGALNVAIRQAYIQSVRHVPGAYGWFYHRTDVANPDARVQHLLNHLGKGPLLRFLQETRPPVVISTYPTPAGVISDLKREHRFHGANLAVVTDYTVHGQWVHPRVDTYFVGAPEVRDGIVRRWRIPPERILVTGIPVDLSFAAPVDRAALRRRWGFDDRPVVVFMAGGYGMIGDFGRVVSALADLPQDLILAVVGGKNPARQAEAQAAGQGRRNPVYALGYVDPILDLLGAADILVSKAGGLTVSEALCQAVPLVIYRPIIGQETRNTTYLVRRGAARWARNRKQLVATVADLIRDPGARAELSANARAAAHPDAAREVARFALNCLKEQVAVP